MIWPLFDIFFHRLGMTVRARGGPKWTLTSSTPSARVSTAIASSTAVLARSKSAADPAGPGTKRCNSSARMGRSLRSSSCGLGHATAPNGGDARSCNHAWATTKPSGASLKCPFSSAEYRCVVGTIGMDDVTMTSPVWRQNTVSMWHPHLSVENAHQLLALQNALEKQRRLCTLWISALRLEWNDFENSKHSKDPMATAFVWIGVVSLPFSCYPKAFSIQAVKPLGKTRTGDNSCATVCRGHTCPGVAISHSVWFL